MPRDIIDSVAKFQKGWHSGLPETPCGYGSKLSTTDDQRKWIPQQIKKYGIKSIADIGCGDLNWIKHTDLCGAEYTGYDLIPRVEGVVRFNLAEEVPPAVDMIMCFWVLNHLPINSSRQAIKNLKASGSKYLMMTDRPIWHCDQPDEIQMPYIEKLVLNHKNDRILLIEL